MGKELKRISLMVREDHYHELSTRGINVSGLIRDMMDDYLSDHKIILGVSEETHSLYEKIVSNTGTTDEELEPYLKNVLKGLLDKKINEMQALANKLR